MNPKSAFFARFKIGRFAVTPNALAQLTFDDVLCGIQRHLTGDWGDLSAEDRQANDQAVVEGTRILSAYQAANGTKFWIITDAGHWLTTVLLPEDY